MRTRADLEAKIQEYERAASTPSVGMADNMEVTDTDVLPSLAIYRCTAYLELLLREKFPMEVPVKWKDLW